MVNIGYYGKCSRLSMLFHEILVDPHHDVILESAFDHLVKEIR